MYWYGGSIAEAVTLSKQKNAIFVVFVEGDNDLSTEMATTIDDAAVLTRLSNQSHFLAIKLKSGSPNYTHFAQIYQFVPVPSLFFIGRNGTPLEVVCAGVQPDNLATRIDRILEEHYKDKPPMQPSTSAQNVREQTLNFLEGESASPAKTEAVAPIKVTETMLAKESSQKTVDGDKEAVPPPAKVVKKNPDPQEYECDGDVCIRKPSKPDEPGTSQIHADASPAPQETLGASGSGGSIEEKLDRAKELIEARRREKAEKEKELEKEKERERRTTGKGVAELKRWQAEQELKQIQEERRREKLEDSLARQRVLQQIARDRAERRARDAPAQPPAPPCPAPPPPISGDGGNRARVQFKLPDGTSHTAHFDADGTLGDVQTYVTNNLQLPTASFSLWTAFPRRELTECTADLRSLGLAPSAALLVLPRQADTVTPAPSYARVITFLTHLFTTLILEPSQQLFNWIRARMFPPPAISRGNTPAPVNREPSPLGLRRRGNIHRLPTDRGSDDDDNNTWNGNSTQQM